MPSLTEPPGTVEAALAARRDAYESRRALTSRCAVAWTVLGVGSGLVAIALGSALLGNLLGATTLLVLGLVAVVRGFASVDHALAELRAFDARVLPLPAARLRLAPGGRSVPRLESRRRAE